MMQAVSRGLSIIKSIETDYVGVGYMLRTETDARMAGIGVDVKVCLSNVAASADAPAWSCTAFGMSWDPIVLSAVAGKENQFSAGSFDVWNAMIVGSHARVERSTHDEDARLADDAVLCVLEQAIALLA